MYIIILLQREDDIAIDESLLYFSHLFELLFIVNPLYIRFCGVFFLTHLLGRLVIGLL